MWYNHVFRFQVRATPTSDSVSHGTKGVMRYVRRRLVFGLSLADSYTKTKNSTEAWGHDTQRNTARLLASDPKPQNESLPT